MASTKLTRTPGSAGNRKTWTFSAWIKKSKVSAELGLLWSNPDTNNHTAIRFTSANELRCLHVASGSTGNGFDKKTNRLFRDVNAWYHIVVAVDTTLSTATDRVKFYVNGVQETSFATDTFGASQNLDTYINSTELQEIGNENSAQYFDGSMAHVHLTDGTAYDADTFGETDSTSGIWKPKVAPSVTYGTNGFFLKFQDSSSLGDDSSGNTNDFTLSGSGKQILDTPSNVFATLNPLDKGYTSALTLANGNLTTMNTSGASDYGLRSTLGVSSGKWYWEIKHNAGNTLTIMDIDIRLQINMQGGTPRAGSYGVQRYDDNGTNVYTNGTISSNNTAMWGGLVAGDIVGFALDCDNGKLFLSKNGSFKDTSGNTGVPASGTNPTFSSIDTSKTWTFYTELRSNGNNDTQCNFGNGYFGTTAVSSAENDDAGYGKFEYSPPTGFYALCTKNINTYG